jgi:hypothetical protein
MYAYFKLTLKQYTYKNDNANPIGIHRSTTGIIYPPVFVPATHTSEKKSRKSH